MSSKIEVSKALSDELSGLFTKGFLDDRMVDDIVAAVRKYSAPVVERQPLPIYQVRYLGDGGTGWSDVEKDELDQLKPRKDYHTRTVFDAPPELAELQATIARLESEAMYSAAGFQAAKDEIERLKSESFEDMYNAAIDERDALIERLNGGQDEPVAVVLPNRMTAFCGSTVADFKTYEEAKGWNACLDRVKELNQ